jgi:hypothetical protein
MAILVVNGFNLCPLPRQNAEELTTAQQADLVDVLPLNGMFRHNFGTIVCRQEIRPCPCTQARAVFFWPYLFWTFPRLKKPSRCAVNRVAKDLKIGRLICGMTASSSTKGTALLDIDVGFLAKVAGALLLTLSIPLLPLRANWRVEGSCPR